MLVKASLELVPHRTQLPVKLFSAGLPFNPKKMSSGCNCGSDCSCGDSCRCGEEITTTQTIIVGVGSVKKHYDGSGMSYGAENDGCNCGSSCSCDDCKCGK